MAYNSGYWEEQERSLRKQLAEARAENAALVAEFQRLADEPPTLEEIAADLDKIEMLEKELAEARADLRLAKNIIETHVERVAERDKLIEQMREALIEALQSADSEWENKNLGHDWEYACEQMRAALEAAERDE